MLKHVKANLQEAIQREKAPREAQQSAYAFIDALETYSSTFAGATLPKQELRLDSPNGRMPRDAIGDLEREIALRAWEIANLIEGGASNSRSRPLGCFLRRVQIRERFNSDKLRELLEVCKLGPSHS